LHIGILHAWSSATWSIAWSAGSTRSAHEMGATEHMLLPHHPAHHGAILHVHALVGGNCSAAASANATRSRSGSTWYGDGIDHTAATAAWLLLQMIDHAAHAATHAVCQHHVSQIALGNGVHACKQVSEIGIVIDGVT